MALDAFDKNEEKHIKTTTTTQLRSFIFRQKKMNTINSTGFYLLSKLLSQALFSTLHPFGFEGGKGGVVIARPRVGRRSSSLDFVSCNEKNKLLVESLFFSLRLFVVRFEFDDAKKYTEDTEEEDALVRGTRRGY